MSFEIFGNIAIEAIAVGGAIREMHDYGKSMVQDVGES